MKHEARPAIHMKKHLGGPVSWVGYSLRDLHGGASGVSQVDGVSDVVPTSQLSGSVGRGFRKGTLASSHLSVWRTLFPRSCLDARHFSSSLYASGAFQAATLVLELKGNESE